MASGFPNKETLAAFLMDVTAKINEMNGEEEGALLGLVEIARKRAGLRPLEEHAWTDNPDEDESTENRAAEPETEPAKS